MTSQPGKKIVCRVRVDDAAKSVEFTWMEGSASFKTYALEEEQFDDFGRHVGQARSRLRELVKLHSRPADEQTPGDLCITSFELAKAGRNLYTNLFDPAAKRGEHVETVKNWLGHLTASGQVESLEIVCDGRPWYTPWNVVYDELPADVTAFAAADGQSPPGFEPFWGIRYNLCGGQTVDPLRRMPLPARPTLLVVIDPVVLDDLGDYAEPDGATQRDRLEAFLASHALVPISTPEALAKALVADRPHVIYWLGHATPDALYLGRDSINQTDLRDTLKEMKRVPGVTGGLVFLNACGTAGPGGVLGSFLKTFHDYGFCGLIATEEQTLDSYASPFGLGVLERFLVPGTAIGGLLHEFRRTHAPLSLLYGNYCPPDLHVSSSPLSFDPRGRLSETLKCWGVVGWSR